MPIKRSHSQSSSPELGEGDFGTQRNPKTGRPIRKSAGRKLTGSGFVDWDSVLIASDEDEKESVDEKSYGMAETAEDDIDLAPNIFKRVKRVPRDPTPPPPLSPTLSSVYSFSPASSPELEGSPTILAPVTLNINVEPGHKGPIQLQLDLNPLYRQILVTQSRGHLEVGFSNVYSPRSSSYDATKIGFLTLASELRNQVYHLVFESEKPLCFAYPSNFCRSSQLLRTCSQIHSEARPFLYSGNKFIVERRSQLRGKAFVEGDPEIGYRDFLRFLRQAGPENVGMLRDLTITFEDAAPTGDRRCWTPEERRFVYDDVLLSCLRNLARHGKLRKLSLSFQGKRELRQFDRHFMDTMKGLKADEVRFVHLPGVSIEPSNWASYRFASKQQDSVRDELIEKITRKEKLYD
ncbi:hypothetical protein EV356DRAFT_513772 [Viridothelium virens]|uniref:Uncharacterized protein n=1 Tax=Viridothelium virens TaxID=1048519 RepID=A0A6A6HPH6_VIRVR|nr:hypothetical protein EV356DRAFT_513772 [Viridothelium virens]